MAQGYILNTPRRRNGGTGRAVTMVNPRPRAGASGWRQARVVSPGQSAGQAKRNPSRIASGRVVTKKAGKKRNPASTPRRNTVTGKVVTSGAPKKNVSGRKTTRKRSQSRSPARKATKVATAKKRPGYTWRKGYVRNGKRVKGTWVKNAVAPKRNAAKPKRNMKTKRKIRKNQGYVIGPSGRRQAAPIGASGARQVSASEMKKWQEAQRKKRAAAAKKASAAKKTTTTRTTTTAASSKCPRGKVLRRAYTTKTGKRVPATCVKKIKKGQKRYKVKGYTKKSGRVVRSYMRHRPGMSPKSKARKTKTKRGHYWRKGYKTATGKRVPGTWVKKPSTAKRKKVTTKKRKRATGRRRAGTYLVRSYRRKYPKRKKAMRRNPPKRPNKKAVWVKGYTRSDGVRVKGHYMTPATKRRKKVTRKKARRRAAPKRRKTVRVGSYLRKVAGKKRRIRVGAYTRKLATKRRRAPSRKRAVSRRRAPARKRVNGRRKGTLVKVPRHKRNGKWVKAYSYRLKKGSTKRKGRVARNPYKRSKVSVKSYMRKRPGGKRRSRSVKSYKRSQWYPHRSRSGKRWITNAYAKRMGLLTKREKAALAKRMRRNPSGMMALLPAKDQLMIVGKKVGIGAIGFGGAVAMGVALNRVSMLTQYFGNWTPVLGNVAAGLGYWALASAMDNEDLKEMRVPVAVGAGLAAVFNIANQLVARNTIPANIASWILPGAGSVAAAPEAAIEANGNGNGNGVDVAAAYANGFNNGAAAANGALTNGSGDGTSGFGQIDVYEAALDGYGGIEEELEMELSHMSGMGDGVFDTSPDGIFDGMSGAGEYMSAPMGAMVEEAYAGTGEYLDVPMGAMVEEAYAGTGEYLDVPMGEYMSVPMGAMVEEAYAGTGEYLDVPMGEYLDVPMGAMVEEAYAGMGQASAAQLEQSIRNRPLMPGFRNAVQKMVRKRIAQGQPINDEFYGKVGKAAAAMARKKFQERAALVSGKPQDLVKEPWKAPLLRSSAPTYKKPIPTRAMVPGKAEPIAKRGPIGYEGIFQDSDTDGIF